MDSDKLINLSMKLMEMTSNKEIDWKLEEQRSFPSQIDEEEYGSRAEINNIQRQMERISLAVQLKKPWVEYTFCSSSIEDNKVLRLIGRIYSDDKVLRGVRLQLWNQEKNELIYEYPSNSSFKDLFQLVKNRGVFEADNFIDRLLQRNHQPELVGA